MTHRGSYLVVGYLCLCGVLAACTPPPSHDLILRGGSIYDGSGNDPFVGDVAIDGDKISALGNLGKGTSMGPLNDIMKAEMVSQQGDIRYDVEWTSLAEYLDYLEQRGVSANVASFIGAANPREYVIGHEDRPPTPEELEQMRSLVREAMEDGALGVASSLMYPPGLFADTSELVELSKVAAECDGMYISHMRDEGAHMIEAVEEVLTIAREANIRAEIYHIKSSGQANWPLFDKAVEMVEVARRDGLEITADVYTYPAGSTGLNVTIPPWVQEGGFDESTRRMSDPVLREQIIREMNTPSDDWENMFVTSRSSLCRKPFESCQHCRHKPCASIDEANCVRAFMPTSSYLILTRFRTTQRLSSHISTRPAWSMYS